MKKDQKVKFNLAVFQK